MNISVLCLAVFEGPSLASSLDLVLGHSLWIVFLIISSNCTSHSEGIGSCNLRDTCYALVFGVITADRSGMTRCAILIAFLSMAPSAVKTPSLCKSSFLVLWDERMVLHSMRFSKYSAYKWNLIVGACAVDWFSAGQSRTSESSMIPISYPTSFSRPQNPNRWMLIPLRGT